MDTADEVRDAGSPHRVTEVIIVAFAAAMVAIAYWVDRRYSRWALERSPLAGHRARVAAFKTGYRRRRSSLSEATSMVGEILAAIGLARSSGGS